MGSDDDWNLYALYLLSVLFSKIQAIKIALGTFEHVMLDISKCATNFLPRIKDI